MDDVLSCVDVTEHCLNEAFNASCPEGRVVLITEARFGRMRPGRCIGGAFNVGCYKDIKPHLDALCTARSRCDVSVRDLVDLHPCQRDFVSYLEVGYVCVEGRAAQIIQTLGKYDSKKLLQYIWQPQHRDIVTIFLFCCELLYCDFPLSC